MFTEYDLESMKARGIERETVERHIDLFTKGASHMKLVRPATIGDGIVRLSSSRIEYFIKLHRKASKEGRIMKFVPASGAASRMFRDLLKFMTEGDETASLNDLRRSSNKSDQIVYQFFTFLGIFAFFQKLSNTMERDDRNIRTELESGHFKIILSYLLTNIGLDYAQLPKALLEFHSYGSNTRTPLEEHLVEAIHCTVDNERKAHLHFTFSPGHLDSAQSLCASVLPYYEKDFGVGYDISLSIQYPSTDTIAVDLENKPFRDERGNLLFRPGGHGALLRNLNECEGDIVFLKNIDNVVPDHLKEHTRLCESMLAGCLVSLQEIIFKYLTRLMNGETDNRELEEMAAFASYQLNANIPDNFKDISSANRCEILIERFNRPLRICGMVVNEGEPGGGPFWIQEKGGVESLQIIENAQVDFTDLFQTDIWNSSTHFNPVALLCSLRDYEGKSFNLENYVDHEAVFISEKSYQGKTLKALELPGLWNGGMAYWNSVFVEIPPEAFNPVKIVTDLLRGTHQPAD